MRAPEAGGQTHAEVSLAATKLLDGSICLFDHPVATNKL